MKNAFKLGFLSLALSLTFAACGEPTGKGGGVDSVTTDSSTMITDTTKVDTLVKDSTVSDTTIKTTTTTEEVKH